TSFESERVFNRQTPFIDFRFRIYRGNAFAFFVRRFKREQAKDDGSSAHRCLHCGSQLAS
ncbi:hypothetical protein ABLN86_17315, partial [Mycobacterium tuberculosis]